MCVSGRCRVPDKARATQDSSCDIMSAPPSLCHLTTFPTNQVCNWLAVRGPGWEGNPGVNKRVERVAKWKLAGDPHSVTAPPPQLPQTSHFLMSYFAGYLRCHFSFAKTSKERSQLSMLFFSQPNPKIAPHFWQQSVGRGCEIIRLRCCSGTVGDGGDEKRERV